MSALSGVRVVELANERIALAGKLLADMGADVVLVEPRDGDPARRRPPLADAGAERGQSLWWWHYHTSKRGVTLDFADPSDKARMDALIASADILLESEPPGRLAQLGFDYQDLAKRHPGLIFVSITPFGRGSQNASAPVTDLTMLAGAGPVWLCGYDDHQLPPVRGGGDQGYHTGCHYAVMAALTALMHRLVTGEGQLVDVSFHAASNLTTEGSTYSWLLAHQTLRRQTGRHAAPTPTEDIQALCRDGRWVNTGMPPRSAREFALVLEWLNELNLVETFPEAMLLEMGARLERPITFDQIGVDKELTSIFSAGRSALVLIAAATEAYTFFIGCQRRGLAVGVIYSPDEAFEDEHFRARGFQVKVRHDESGRDIRYPGAPYRLSATPWAITRPAPKLGEHNAEVLGSLSAD